VARRVPPTLLGTFAAFILCGPLFIVWSLLLFSLSSPSPTSSDFGDYNLLELAAKLALAAIGGAFLWLASIVSREGWLLTIAPTTIAAALYWAMSTVLVNRALITPRTRIHAVVASVAVACVVSALSFACFLALREGTWSPQALQPSAFLIALVGIDGALVGLVLGAFWRTRGDA
jgi:hypothetical protein